MAPIVFWSRSPVRLAAGLVAGAMIVWLDNVAFEGEISPIVIVAMLLAVTATAGAVWGWRAWTTAAAAWACVPAAHVTKYVLGWPDTLHPNTYVSILYLAVFTLAVAIAGFGVGVLTHRLTAGAVRPDSKSRPDT